MSLMGILQHFLILRVFKMEILLLAVKQDAEKYKLDHPSCFHYLNQRKLYELEGASNVEEYLKTRKATDIVGFSLGCQV
ncbi:myosin-15-like [Zingiber officinale]|uniref:myosin-15-like n=1 Tax=Zingiber officinale TaxID=94328 RepID=UPI001C4DC568|nr:myosin-15-like [Zingiber officinale]